MDDRKQFLMRIYDQMFADINRHILVVWQSATALVGGIAVLALAEKGILPIDLGTAVVVLLSGWLLAHLLDAGYWYNRNLAIIANIERQFLEVADLRNVHYYFGAHRPKNRMLTHLKIQAALGIGLGFLVLLHHFVDRILPGFTVARARLDLLRAIPYLAALSVSVYLWRVRDQRSRSYAEFIRNSPGVEVDSSGIMFGVGHGFKDGETPDQ